MTAIIEYWIGTYHGTVEVPYDPETDEQESLFARARKQLANGTSLPIASESYRLVDTREN